ncbi:type-F conjugative transfer system protein TraW [Thiothrix sp.]|jgi:conjugal transfer pilus assembly protein TraW|uniref:type-F conjugative transfer system protein TraW n=1 Tax=Thiothrix sp. TaxID=1032 RepID=UPI00257B5CBA|nr:type-F conjugative transfer system protein TraW [Thiothrix sp.]
MHSKGTPTGLQHLTTLSVLLGIAVCVHSPALASAAALGKTYPIAERDFLEVIHERLQAKQAAGEIDAMQQAMRATALNTIENPTPVPGINRATQAQTHYYDPSVVAEKAIHDASGKVVVAAGTRVNPLEYLGLSKVLLFIDGSDAQQLAYADDYYQTSNKPVKVILVGGSYMQVMRQWKRPVYFDQGGYLTQRLAIKHVPTLVYQDKPTDSVLRIDSIVLPHAPTADGATP